MYNVYALIRCLEDVWLSEIAFELFEIKGCKNQAFPTIFTQFESLFNSEGNELSKHA